jgi:DinB family protein
MTDFVSNTTDLLRRTPGVLRALLGGIDDAWTGTPDSADGWRPRDVVGHLISAEHKNYLERARRILEDGTSKAFDGFDRFEMLERDKGRTLDELLDEFARLRAANVSALEDLVRDADLDTRGLHPALGEVTLRELLATWSVHDLDHVAQVYAGMAGSRDADVGPWKVYLGILLRRDDPAAVAG